jgi:hypothetical protein
MNFEGVLKAPRGKISLVARSGGKSRYGRRELGKKRFQNPCSVPKEYQAGRQSSSTPG